MSWKKIWIVAVFALGLAACGRGPATPDLTRDIEERLAKAFDPGAIEIASFDRRGSAADSTAPSGEDRRIVYYDAVLRLKKDLDLGAWDKAGAASLVTILGAGPKGIRGVKSGGNKANDEISTHGTAIYRHADGAWKIVTPAGYTAPTAPVLETIAPRGPLDQFRAALENVVHAYPPGTSPAQEAIINDELARSVAAIQSRLARLSQVYPVAAGPDGGQYVRFVRALETLKPGGVRIQGLLTEGSVENINLLRQGQAYIAMAQSDIAAAAVEGKGPFAKQGRFADLRAVASLYPEPLHILVKGNSWARSVQDLRQKVIVVGPSGSGTRTTAEALLAAHGMHPDREYRVSDLSLAAGLEALKAGKVEAVMQVTGMPDDRIRAAAASMPLKILPVDPGVLSRMTNQNKSILYGVIPRGAYHGVTQDIPALAVSALLVVTTEIGELGVGILIKTIFGSKSDFVRAGSVQGAQLNAATARLGVTIPFAGGAEAALEELSKPVSQK